MKWAPCSCHELQHCVCCAAVRQNVCSNNDKTRRTPSFSAFFNEDLCSVTELLDTQDKAQESITHVWTFHNNAKAKNAEPELMAL